MWGIRTIIFPALLLASVHMKLTNSYQENTLLPAYLLYQHYKVRDKIKWSQVNWLIHIQRQDINFNTHTPLFSAFMSMVRLFWYLFGCYDFKIEVFKRQTEGCNNVSTLTLSLWPANVTFLLLICTRRSLTWTYFSVVSPPSDGIRRPKFNTQQRSRWPWCCSSAVSADCRGRSMGC